MFTILAPGGITSATLPSGLYMVTSAPVMTACKHLKICSVYENFEELTST